MDHHNINIRIPVRISYASLEEALRLKLVGEYISAKDDSGEEVKYAQVLGVSLFNSNVKSYDITVALRLKVLRTLFKRDSVDIYVHAAMGYDNGRQQLFLSRYNLDVRTSSSFYNAGLEVLANTIASNKILGKTRLDLGAKITEQVQKVNGQLETGLEVKGLRLTGAVSTVNVQDLMLQASGVSLQLIVSADVDVEVVDLLSLIPADLKP
ncbi:DUF4403 family protein [Cesiribacter sp. SM1]|uniref:DUF4403 family protein n=1 Tax=Cesiribacter sp. SM1 TaxID=2861196 RepID=UPI001CD4B537|nr:DUF4403 family protein [Cesiribacter sp. SM1]